MNRVQLQIPPIGPLLRPLHGSCHGGEIPSGLSELTPKRVLYWTLYML